MQIILVVFVAILIGAGIKAIVKAINRTSKPLTMSEQEDPTLRRRNITSTVLFGHDSNKAVRDAAKVRKEALKEIAADEKRAALEAAKKDILRSKSK